MDNKQAAEKRGGARPGAGRKPRYPGGSEMVRIPCALKPKVIAFLDLYSEYILEGEAPASRSDEPTRKKLIEDLKGMITFERNRLTQRAKSFEDRRQTNLFNY